MVDKIIDIAVYSFLLFMFIYLFGLVHQLYLLL